MILLPHQNRSVQAVEAMLRARGGACLANAPGSGKSWIAAEVARRAFAVGASIDLVVPSNLRADWMQLSMMFQFSADFYDHASLFREHIMPLITPRRLVIVDEAHQFRNGASRRFAALAQLCVGQRVLLITATPFWNSLSDLQTLVSLLVPDDGLRDVGVFSIEQTITTGHRDGLRVIVKSLFVREDEESTRQLLPRVERRIVRFSAGSREIFGLVTQLRFPPFDATARNLLRELLLLRLASGKNAFGQTIDRQIAFCERAVEVAARGERLTREDFSRHFVADMHSGNRQQLLFPQLFGSGAADEGDPVSLTLELERLRRIRASPFESDKLEGLKRVVKGASEARFLVFTSSVATAKELVEAFSDLDARSITSEMERTPGTGAREQVLRAFSQGEIRMLIATDWCSEGLNLQSADAIIHYDLPWNQSRIAQRTARACRIGRSRAVESWYFVSRETELRRALRTIRRKRSVERLLRDRGPRAEVLPLPPLPPLPPRSARNSAPSRFARRLRGLSLAGDTSHALLVSRFRAGSELILSQMSSEFVDEARLGSLFDFLRADLELVRRAQDGSRSGGDYDE